ncbi:MAG TPA: hypothetical protein VFB02_04105 [Bradyrhizobium sp.]|nr:hypothetical protein [Bradyrhizobium sp.]
MTGRPFDGALVRLAEIEPSPCDGFLSEIALGSTILRGEKIKHCPEAAIAMRIGTIIPGVSLSRLGLASLIEV